MVSYMDSWLSSSWLNNVDCSWDNVFGLSLMGCFVGNWFDATDIKE
jgi:hypothetical protein